MESSFNPVSKSCSLTTYLLSLDTKTVPEAPLDNFLPIDGLSYLIFNLSLVGKKSLPMVKSYIYHNPFIIYYQFFSLFNKRKMQLIFNV